MRRFAEDGRAVRDLARVFIETTAVNDDEIVFVDTGIVGVELEV